MTDFYSNTINIAKDGILITLVLFAVVFWVKRFGNNEMLESIWQTIQENWNKVFSHNNGTTVDFDKDSTPKSSKKQNPKRFWEYGDNRPTAHPTLAVRITRRNSKRVVIKYINSNAITTIIGQSRSCDIRIDNRFVPHEQLSITYKKGSYTFKNLSSSKEIYHGGKAVTEGEITRGYSLDLHGGVSLTFGLSVDYIGASGNHIGESGNYVGAN